MMTEELSILHKANILIHVSAGSLALVTGIILVASAKGKKLHKTIGKIFLALLAIVIVTGLAGVFLYGRNAFLLVITVLSGYSGYSGYRTLQTKSNQPKSADTGAAFIVVLIVIYFLYYFNSIGMIWAPVIIYSTTGYLVLMITYDFSRYLIPAATYSNLWLYEHILKMVSAFSALLSAFTGTVFPQYQPYSQFLPSVFGTLLAIGFMINIYKKRRAFAKKQG